MADNFSALDDALARIIGTPGATSGQSFSDFLSNFGTQGATTQTQPGFTANQAVAPAATAAPAAAAAPAVDPLIQYKSDYAAGKYSGDKALYDPIAQQIYKQFGQPGNQSGDINTSISEYEQYKKLGVPVNSMIDPNMWGTYVVPEKRTQMQEAYKAAGGLGLNPAPASGGGSSSKAPTDMNALAEWKKTNAWTQGPGGQILSGPASAASKPVDPKATAWQAEYDRASKGWQDNYNAISSAYNAQQAQRMGGGSSSPGVPTDMNALAQWKKMNAWSQGPGGQIMAKK